MKFARLVTLVIAMVLAPLAARAQQADPSGDWRGTLTQGAVNVRLALHLGETSTLDSPDQSVTGLPLRAQIDGRRVTVTNMDSAAVFEGEVSEDGARLVGSWRRGAATFPISFERGVFAPLNRPQIPVAPFPYRAEEVGYDNARRPGVHLAGTLTVPEGRGRFPAVLLITGSGAQDRNEAIMGHQPFLVLADYLSRRGFAVLRVDDRGVGGSTGASASPPGASAWPANDTSHDYVTDVEAGIAFLRARRDIDPRRIALIGHSEGGLIAPLVASRDPSLAAIVMWAGPGVPGAEVLVEQVRATTLSMGASAEAAETAARISRETTDAIMAAPDAETARTAAVAVLTRNGAPEAQVQAQLPLLSSPWYRTFIAYDPAPTLRGLRMPVLALLGEKDVHVEVTQNKPALRAALAGNRRARVMVLPGLNHLFQTSNTGAISEYGQIEETIAPEALAAMGDWLTETLRPRRRR